MQILKISIATVLILTKVGFVTSYPTGAPSSICGSMVPGHPPSTTSGAPPYSINITASGDQDEVVIHGTLYSTNGTLFRGFLIEPVPGNGIVGVMSGNDNSSKNVCGTNGDQGLTHTDNTNKSRVDFKWTFTNDSIGDIQFRATVVEVCCDESRYWLNITSNKLGPPRPLSTSSSSPPVASSSQAPRAQINFDPECGKSKGCFSDCNSTGCTYLVTWQKQNNNNSNMLTEFNETGTIIFDLKMKLPETKNKWVALGISPDGSMDGTNVAACLSQPSGVTLQSSYNDGYSNVLFNDTTLGLSLVTGEVTDGIIHCQFTRVISLNNETKFLDLNQKYYALVGSGNVINDTIQKHDTDPVASPDKIDFTKNSIEPFSTTGTPIVTSPTSKAPSGQINFDPNCGKSKGCFSDCSSAGCTYLVTWEKNNSDVVTNAGEDGASILFDIKMKLADTNNQWVAVGISPAGKMDGTDVAACLSQPSGVTLQSSYNDGYTNVLFNDTTLGLSLITGEVMNGIIHCQFSRIVSLENETKFLDLNKKYYMLVGSGKVLNGVIQKHDTDPVPSPDKIDFMKTNVEPMSTTGTPTVTNPSTTPSPSGGIVYDPACGISKGCFPDCLNKQCTYLVTWHRNITKNGLQASSGTGDVIFDIKMNLGDTTNKWIAVGISPQGKMSDTNVAACLSQSSGISLKSSYNNDVSNILYADPLLGLKLLGSDVSNGIIHCRFSRVEKMANQPKFLDLNETYYLVVATGPVASGFIRQHTTDPYKSQNRVNFLENYVSKEDTSGPSTLVKLHASLMVIAWVFLSSVGLVAARHCKSMLAEKLYFKVKAWFLVHRSFMVVAVICIIIAFVVIFVEVGGFSKIAAEAGKEYTKAHPYIGIASTGLALLNWYYGPVLALSMNLCKEDDKFITFSLYIVLYTFFIMMHMYTYLTNLTNNFLWIADSKSNDRPYHLNYVRQVSCRRCCTWWSQPILPWIPYLSYGLVITMFFGIELNTAKVHQSAFYVLTAYCVIYVFVHFCLEIYRRNDSTEAHGAVHRTNSSSNLISDVGSKQSSFTFYMLIIHGVFMLVVAVFLVVIICLPQKMKNLFDH